MEPKTPMNSCPTAAFKELKLPRREGAKGLEPSINTLILLMKHNASLRGKYQLVKISDEGAKTNCYLSF
ncbi:hypothetical protein [Vibrio rotiferianus]|uniref:hypothetical protein n=1 Tax=Vibrio rotiferianus TaxID=190895 RepID=UPI00406A8189